MEAAALPEDEERAVVVENLRDRLAERKVRLEQARAREAELSRRLDEMKKFVRVMEILKIYLRRQYGSLLFSFVFFLTFGTLEIAHRSAFNFF